MTGILPEVTPEELELMRLAWGEWAGLTPDEIIDRADDDLVRVMARKRYEQVNAWIILGSLKLRDERDEHARESEWNVHSDPSS